ncbi:UDP-glucose:glycoprotein glucosyltransferase [Lachnellula occidentalis]|uniref:UDP-glucose:glycoprotein glucosyltransferase n=1 Tax=Lachnellula occidentalis TaxID=215460 RepID=A0A8H8UD08_9HELO|nr:UDP-glucose:glycoprotein glucosyltransferase [Lachnellula occidentalis]
MGAFDLSWGLTGALLATTYLHSICASAGPSINVGLKASFSSAPYLLELLETAADENATSYYPLLDRIADGHFSKASTDKQLYDQFIEVLKEDGHITDLETLSSYKFALSMRTSAPRIEAHYQYYHTAAEPSLQAEEETSCPTWVLFGGKQYCSPILDAPHGDINGDLQTQELPFDRILGNPTAPLLSYFGEDGSRGKALSAESKPLLVPGYGVELALKRTDYIVIDDREDDDSKSIEQFSEKEVKFEDEELADLKPLSSSELFSLGLKASSFIMQSENPFETLVKLSQDFPKYSSAIASHNATKEFVTEHDYNRAQLVPGGYNIWWMNGVQVIEREIEALSILELLRAERKLINGVRELGLTGQEAIQLLSHQDIATVQAEGELQRFDWRDDIEGGNVIIWMNDIEKDKRYGEWPTSVQAMLQRTYPGQLPSVRKDCFYLVLPIDFSKPEDVLMVVETLQSFVKRKLTIRIGLVPISSTIQSLEQARVVYHLLDTYNLSTVISYLERSYTAGKVTAPSRSIFEAAVEGKTPKGEKVSREIYEVLKSNDYQDQVEASQKWIHRLSAGSKIPPMFVDGVALPRDENWLQSMSKRVTADLQSIQQGIFEESLSDETWLPTYFLTQAAKKRNSLVIPEDEKSLRVFNVNKIVGENQDLFNTLPRVKADPASEKADWAHMILFTDLEAEEGARFLATAAVFREANPGVELVIVHNSASDSVGSRLSADLFALTQHGVERRSLSVNDLTKLLSSEESAQGTNKDDVLRYWNSADLLAKSIAVTSGQSAILLNGRLVGPIPNPAEFDLEDFEQLLSYERNNRIVPAYTALEALGLSDKIADPLAAAKLSSIVAISTIDDKPAGMFEQASTLRMSKFDVWNSSHTALEVGDATTASIQMTVLVDPASEHGQKWVPLLKAISELDGVYLKLFLNPKERLQELPIRHRLKANFDDAGALKDLSATFTGVPQEALLNLGMDVPPAWLVAPKVSIHDLDNIKLSSIKTNVDALYELEHILIEGHSREIPGGAPPRGAQLVLGTERDPHFADTIIMANLGYFQFKANPGFYKIDLQQGRSSEIFKIDSVGAQGWSPVPGDNTTEVVLMSFQGTTLYPRLSRKPGMKTEDVLEAKSESKSNIVSQGFKFAQGILGKGKPAVEMEAQADINIFSVASGHLYERMLNIMMVSVMKHTKHTVKFWFIEQFLSPSFKDFIPYLAAEYGFKYEMVTYKWPHWLRSQTEKQREIWGYKILFLDVLFPLSLDKVIFVDADQIVRTNMIELVNHDLKGAPYGFTPMCDSRTEMEGFRFWKQGYWERFLAGLPYHISALYVVDLHKFRQIAAGDRLRQQYHQLSADPNSLSNLDQDLPNHMQNVLKIHSLPQEWLWCETWCSDESLEDAKTIDLCNNPQTKEPKLDRARRQVPEWTVYDDEIAAVDRRRKGLTGNGEKKNEKSRTLEEEPVATSKKDEL